MKAPDRLSPDDPGCQTKAFTLVELLVVVAVIAILAALLLPVISTAKRKSQRIHCVNNIRQIVMASYVYVSDNNQYPTYVHPSFPLIGVSWVAHFTDSKSKLLFCPSAPLRLPPPASGNRQGTADQAWVRWTEDGKTMFSASYGYNAWLYPDLLKYWPGGKTESMVFTRGGVERPPSTPVLVDANWCGLSPKEDDPPARDLYNGVNVGMPANMGRCTIARHGGGNPSSAPRFLAPGQKLPGAIDVGLADGHTELVKLEDLWKLTWHANWVTPATRTP